MHSIPKQLRKPKPLKFSDEELHKIDVELQRFLDKGIIEEVFSSESNEFISNIFTRPKKEGRVRVILNLKQFNELFMMTNHFKMETLNTAINSIRPNCFFGSVDLADAYYSIPITKNDRKFFRFYHPTKNIKYQFTALVMGLSSAPRVFTKILKPVFSHLRSMGHISTVFIDDSCLQGRNYDECLENINTTVQVIDSLGLTVNPNKSVLIPCQQIVFLGFILCSVTMLIRLTPERCQDIVELCKSVLIQKRIIIRLFSKLIGKLVAAAPGVEHSPLYYKPLEKIKDRQLKIHKGNFNSFMNIPKECNVTLNWWIENLSSSSKRISQGAPKLSLYSDASGSGWGGFNETENIRTGGKWSAREREFHINVLELKACQLTIYSFCKDIRNTHIRIFMDNTTSCAYINKYGGKHYELDSVAREIWFWCIERNIFLSAAHIPGKENVDADQQSRIKNEDLEWALRPELFQCILEYYPKLTVDLFASRLNNKLPKYVSRKPDPNAFAIDAFSLTWKNEYFFIFPPFSLIPRILQKITEDKSKAILIAPIWTTQSWWPSLMQLIDSVCYQLPKPQQSLYLPTNPEYRHPLKRMTLGLFPISGEHSNGKMSQNRRENSFCNHGEAARNNNTIHTLQDGSLSVGQELIPFNPI